MSTLYQAEYREFLPNRDQIFRKMQEPDMRELLLEIADPQWTPNKANLVSMINRVARGFPWLPRQNQGLLPYLNADQIIQLKDVIKMREALPAAEFAEVALQIRQEGLQQTQVFLRMLHYADLARAVAKEAEEGEGRSCSWVTRMAERCRLVQRAGTWRGIGRDGARVK
jgi:hypothetical protein